MANVEQETEVISTNSGEYMYTTTNSYDYNHGYYPHKQSEQEFYTNKYYNQSLHQDFEGEGFIQPLDNLNNGYHSRMAPNSNYRMNYHGEQFPFGYDGIQSNVHCIPPSNYGTLHTFGPRYNNNSFVTHWNAALAGIDFNAFALYDVNYSVCCKHLFPTKTSYEVHRIQAHKDGMFKCQVLYCCCTFNQKDLLHKHEAEHHAEEQWGPISCFVCFTILPHPEENEGYVKYHTLMHTSHS
nr:uncharacterized protein LOC121123328 [Lepeophtheirus salmonis]